jgi:hypothetical protein
MRRIPLTLALVVLGCSSEPPRRGPELVADWSGGAAVLTFDAAWGESVSGTLAQNGSALIEYDSARLPDCRGEIAGTPAWTITAFYSLNGGDIESTPVAGHSPTGAPLEPLVPLTEMGDLELWFSNTNAWGCNAYDSNFGDNYHFTVGPPANAPGWMGNAVRIISRWTCNGGQACDGDRVALDQGFRFDTWARQRATIAELAFDVWKDGVTDFDNPDLWKSLDVRVYYRFGGQGEFAWQYVSFEKRNGNDARYAVPLRPLDPLGKGTVVDPSGCPNAPLSITPDNLYVETSVELYFTVNGMELRPAGGGTFAGSFSDYRGLYEPCL